MLREVKIKGGSKKWQKAKGVRHWSKNKIQPRESMKCGQSSVWREGVWLGPSVPYGWDWEMGAESQTVKRERRWSVGGAWKAQSEGVWSPVARRSSPFSFQKMRPLQGWLRLCQNKADALLMWNCTPKLVTKSLLWTISPNDADLESRPP